MFDLSDSPNSSDEDYVEKLKDRIAVLEAQKVMNRRMAAHADMVEDQQDEVSSDEERTRRANLKQRRKFRENLRRGGGPSRRGDGPGGPSGGPGGGGQGGGQGGGSAVAV